MKRTLALLSVAALVATPAVAEAAKKPAKKVPTKRTVTLNYTGTFGATAPGGGGGTLCTANNCLDIELFPYETKATFKATDSTGQKVPLQTSLDDDYAGTVADACSTGEVALAKNSLLSFNTILAPATCQGLATSGTITVTITGLK